MKRIIAVLLIFSLLCGLAGCATEKKPESPGAESRRESSTPAESASVSSMTVTEPGGYAHREPVFHDWDGTDTLYPYAVIAHPGLLPFAFERGALITTETQLHYLDFSSGQVLPFCFRPNCRHDTEDCNAKTSKRTDSFMANNKLYFLDLSSVRAVYDEELKVYAGEIDLYVSSLSGSDEKKIASLRMDMMLDQNSRQLLSTMAPFISTLVLYGDSAFLFYNLVRKSYGDGGPDDPENNYGHCYVTEINLKTDKAVRTETLNTGYNPQVEPVCAYGGGIYLWRWQFDEPILTSLSTETVYYEGKLMSVDEYFDAIQDLMVESCVRYDIVTGEMAQRDDLYPDEYDGPLVDHWDGTIRPLPEFGLLRDWCIINDGDIKAYHLATGEVRTLYEDLPEKDKTDFRNQPGIRQVGVGTMIQIFVPTDEGSLSILYDFETDESHVLGNTFDESGAEIWISDILGRNGNLLYGWAVRAEDNVVIGYGSFDISDGYDKLRFEMMLPV